MRVLVLRALGKDTRQNNLGIAGGGPYGCAMAVDTQAAEAAGRRYAALRAHLDERQRRLLLGVEATELGRGGITAIAAATGVHPDTVGRGVREMEGNPPPQARVREAGGGRKSLAESDPGPANSGAPTANDPADASAPAAPAPAAETPSPSPTSSRSPWPNLSTPDHVVTASHTTSADSTTDDSNTCAA